MFAVFNRPGEAGAVVKTPPSLINSFIKTLTDDLWKYLVVYTTRLLRLNRCHLCHLRGVYLQGS